MNAVRVEADLDNSEHVRMYEDMLDECHEHFSMGGMTFYPSDILKNCDPIAYRCGFFDDFFSDETILGWECSECGEVHDDFENAEDCCKIACENCGELFENQELADACCSEIDDEDEDDDDDENVDED